MTPISRGDKVPSLRSNVAFSTPVEGLGDGLLRVTNMDNGEELRLHGFECSLARMLDGQRPARELVERAEQLGLPLTFEGLEGFLRKLASYDLLSPQAPPHPALQASPWLPRHRWDEPTRNRFREALREGRRGRVEQAVVSLDRLLEQAPETAEARQLREQLEARQPARGAPLFSELFRLTELHWRSVAQAGREAVRAQPAMHRGGALLGGAVLAAMAAVMLLPVPQTVTAPATLKPISSVTLAAPQAGLVAAVPVAVRQWVDKGEVVFQYDTRQTMHSLAELIVRLEQQQREMADSGPRSPTARAARARVQKAELEARQAERALDLARGAAEDGFSEQVRAAEDVLNLALLEVDDARTAQEEMANGRQLARLRRLQAEIEGLQAELLDSEFKAPQSGVITALRVRPGQPVAQGAPVVQLDDTRRLQVTASVDAGQQPYVKAGQPVLLLSGGRALQTEVARVDGPTVQLLIDNSAAAFAPGGGELQIRAESRPLLRWPFHRAFNPVRLHRAATRVTER